MITTIIYLRYLHYINDELDSTMKSYLNVMVDYCKKYTLWLIFEAYCPSQVPIRFREIGSCVFSSFTTKLKSHILWLSGGQMHPNHAYEVPIIPGLCDDHLGVS